MNNILDNKIKMLENIIAEQKAYIESLEKELQLKNNPKVKLDLPEQTINYAPFVSTAPSDACEHDYNYMWHGIAPPPCKKCGKLANQMTVTCHGSVDGTYGTNYSGYIKLGVDPLPAVVVDTIEVK